MENLVPTSILERESVKALRRKLEERISDPQKQRLIVLVIVSTALLLDNMLYMVIVPIMPEYLRVTGAFDEQQYVWANRSQAQGPGPSTPKAAAQDGMLKSAMGWVARVNRDDELESVALGFLFASKALVQLCVSPIAGTIMDHVGYDLPMVFGLGVLFVSTSVFAIGDDYMVMLVARSMQGVGSAFADTSGLAMIADRFSDEKQRRKALGIALAFISFGSLIAPPFGGVLYFVAGKALPFLALALIALLDGALLLVVMKPVRQARAELASELPVATPIWRLILDPFVAVCAGCLVMANVSLAFLEPTLAKWMRDNLQSSEVETGLVWFLAFFPHVAGVLFTVTVAERHPAFQWALAAGGLALEGVSCLVVPMCSGLFSLMLPICALCFGIALVDTALLPTLGYIVDTRYTSVYGSVYAIADLSYSLAYAIGPFAAGVIVSMTNFTWLNILIFVMNAGYAPLLGMLRHMNTSNASANNANNNNNGQMVAPAGGPWAAELGNIGGGGGVVGRPMVVNGGGQDGTGLYPGSELGLVGGQAQQQWSDGQNPFYGGPAVAEKWAENGYENEQQVAAAENTNNPWRVTANPFHS